VGLARPLRKLLRYRDRSGRPASFHADHWRDFMWQSGPVIVVAFGDWGQMKVWAASEAEGRRVIGHAAAAAGISLSGSGGAEWLVATSSDPRFGKVGTMKTWDTPRGLRVSKRPGPGGAPEAGL
jgi:hypothetical protein